MTDAFQFGGCSRKMPEDRLWSILGNSSLASAVSNDCAEVSIGSGLGFTIDSVFPIGENPYEFARMGVVHCIGDLNAKSILASHINLSLNAPHYYSDAQVTQVLDGIADQCRASGLVFGKGHTLLADEFSLTLAALGTRVVPKATLSSAGGRYAILMTKKLGASRLYKLASLDGNTAAREKALSLLTTDHQTIVRGGTTEIVYGVDVSGFGLYSALRELAKQAFVSIQCKLGSPLRCDSVYFDVPTECEYALNIARRSELGELGKNLVPSDTLSLFGTELCGPILWIVTEDAAARFLEKLRGYHSDAQIIATACAIPDARSSVSFEVARS